MSKGFELWKPTKATRKYIDEVLEVMEADRADLYWGAKITMRFTRPHIEAVVAEGKFSDGASKYLVDTLVKRRDKIGRAWLNSVTPLDWFRVEAGEVCFTDLAVHYGVRQSSSIEVLSAENDHAIDLIVLRADGSGCYAVGNKDYTVLRLRVRHHDAPPMQVHVRAGPNPQVLGIVRVE